MKQKFSIKELSLALFCCSLSSCNSGQINNPPNSLGLAKQISPAISLNKFSLKNVLKDNAAKMNIVWSIDNVTAGDLNSALRDLGWHLVTLTVKDVDDATVATPVEGLLAGVFPKPTIDVGQKIVLQDINCNQAVFSKVGDSCSAYFRLDYDQSKGTQREVFFSIKMQPRGSVDSLEAFTANFYPQLSVADFRLINSVESNSYSASEVVKNKTAYQIFQIQNGSRLPINLTTIQASTNPNFTLLHRTDSGINDPYYAGLSECSLQSNSDLKQISSLASLNESCILVYRAAPTATSFIESDNVILGSDAAHFFPSWANHLHLLASYSNGTPIPAEVITAVQGTFHEPSSLNHFDINYSFMPQKLPLNTGMSSSQILSFPDSVVLASGQELLTNGAAVRISKFEPEFNEGQQLATDGGEAHACGGAWANAQVTAYAYRELTKQAMINFAVQSNSSGHCGNAAPSFQTIPLTFDGANQTVYHVDDTGCGGGNWDIGGTVVINGSCESFTCIYNVIVTAHHGGVNGQCQDTQSTQFTLRFLPPTSNNLAYLDTPIQDRISFAALAGQNVNGSIGDSAGALPQTISCDVNGNCNVNGSYSSDAASQDMGYQINLNQGDQFANGNIQFTRSSGYDLNSFNIQVSN